MTAERESMTLQEMGAPALGVEERRDEAPGPENARPTPDPGSSKRPSSPRSIVRILEEAESCTQPGEVGPSPRGSVQLPSWRRARREGSSRPPRRGHPLSAKVRGESGSAGEGAAHRPYDPGRPGKIAESASIQPRTREGLQMAVQSQVACRALGVPRFLLPSSDVGHRSPVLVPNARTSSISPRFATGHRPNAAR